MTSNFNRDKGLVYAKGTPASTFFGNQKAGGPLDRDDSTACGLDNQTEDV